VVNAESEWCQRSRQKRLDGAQFTRSLLLSAGLSWDEVRRRMDVRERCQIVRATAGTATPTERRKP
jgi:hypothetical protein